MIEPYVTEKQCSRCRQSKPLSTFPKRTNRTGPGNVCGDCKAKAAEKRAASDWTAVEIDLIKRIYPTRGSRACAEFMPNRTPNQIGSKASRLNLSYVGARLSGTPAKEEAWAIPTHEYTEADFAWRSARMPTFERRAYL